MQSRDTDAGTFPRRNRRTLWLILAVCAAPVIASYVAFHFWRPAARVNYGELIEPRPLPAADLTTASGKPLQLAALKGHWILLTPGPSACDEACRRKLVYMRQVRLAQGRESARIERVWLVTDGGAPRPQLIAEHAGLHVVRAAEPVLAALPAPRSPADHVYVVDPLGNLMMRFPADPDPQRMLKDLSRLLRHSKWK
jgi:cytochrome oxidase Cu insertion factor (SCO1/SenC/PrrC family)